MSRFPNEKVKSALDAVHEAQLKALAAIEAEYPVGADVVVHHYRGQFGAKVVGHCCNAHYFGYLGYVAVRNDITGKCSMRYHDDLEVL